LIAGSSLVRFQSWLRRADRDEIANATAHMPMSTMTACHKHGGIDLIVVLVGAKQAASQVRRRQLCLGVLDGELHDLLDAGDEPEVGGDRAPRDKWRSSGACRSPTWLVMNARSTADRVSVIAARCRSANSPATTAKAGMTPARPQTSRRASIPISASRTAQDTSSGWSGEPAEVEGLAATIGAVIEVFLTVGRV
jgi:hypothetical protein